MPAMLRIGLLLTIVLLVTPMVRGCCLPVTYAPPCHSATQMDYAPCIANRQAIAEAKAAIAVGSPNSCWEAPASHDIKIAVLATTGLAAEKTELFVPPSDLYLRTGALLI